MSKRRKRKPINQPNLPAETLARARREAGFETENEEPDIAEEPAAGVEIPSVYSPELLPLPKRKRRKEKVLDPALMTQAEISEILANPTRTVTEDELRQQYTYVLADLRSMGLLAGALFVLMILAALLS